MLALRRRCAVRSARFECDRGNQAAVVVVVSLGSPGPQSVVAPIDPQRDPLGSPPQEQSDVAARALAGRRVVYAPYMTKGLDDLAARWNNAGRAYFTEISRRLSRLYGEGARDVDLDTNDPRSFDMGDEVLRAVVELNSRGEWQRVRDLFDPAYGPFFGRIENLNQQLGFVTILSPNELLVRRGNPWSDGITFHLRGGEATPVDDVVGVCRSRNRDYLALARRSGLEIRDARAGIAGFAEPPIASIGWPNMDVLRPEGFSDAARARWRTDDTTFAVEQLAVTDDGMRVVVSCYQQGILLASRHPGDAVWTLLWPDGRPPYRADGADGDEDLFMQAGDMTHVAISRDGARLAWGSQDAGHFLAEVDSGGAPRWYATVGSLIDYPHDACFSDDGRYTALNSCHFYNGATIVFDWEGRRGMTLAPYEEHEEAPCIDRDLRVYASCWLDGSVLRSIGDAKTEDEGLFALAGSGILRGCTLTGAVAFAQGFGSSAGSIDFCPESRRLAIGSYSGFVHLYDPYEEELPGRIDGFRPRREIARWLMWDELPNGPVRW